MVAMFIGAIGVLDRTEMDNFATIFVTYQKRGKETDPDEIQKLDEQLLPWIGPHAPGKRRADAGPYGFSVKVVGVFDTVGSFGMPEELTLRNAKMKSLFGFPDRLLGSHVERAYQALALNEHRADFDCAKFEQTEEGRKKGQVLRQVRVTYRYVTQAEEICSIFCAGSHCDIGGGYEEHDLSDITLNWMISSQTSVTPCPSTITMRYLFHARPPSGGRNHRTSTDCQFFCNVNAALMDGSSRTGIFALSKEIQRKLPTVTDDDTHEVIHSSVLQQLHLVPDLKDIINCNPSIVEPLMVWEERVKTHWETKLAQNPSPKIDQAEERAQEDRSQHHLHEHRFSLMHKAVESVEHLKSGNHEGHVDVQAQLVEELFK
ncbi:hypothetical protein BN946_scf184911.g97 [Trametes cinnabarina]|uniref:T6SS Phospholipase effector Tle1-like catalytic domain-containing protein n=1 Tax=Pycnoporus cinnabarinus TaxID=5643 RepID=A0A060SAU3_PYCCI|nr:hypothetical protein BN946_scf184911.g97 [Trametes cinnabarina]